MQNLGKKAIAEIEFAFKTKEGHYFQPRLRRILEIEEYQNEVLNGKTKSE